jgi:chitodextrinase
MTPGRTALTTALVAVAACSVQETPAPPLTGPSELALRVALQAIPDSILQDGASQAAIQIDVSGADGRPVRAMPLRLEILRGASIVDYGSLSAKTVITGDDGRARTVYTSPPRPAEPVDPEIVITIRATPIGTDYRAELGRTVDLRLVTPGVILLPNQAPQASFAVTPPTPLTHANVIFDASASTDEGQPCGVACSYSWEFGDATKGSGIFATHRYQSPGPFQVRLVVTDARGASGLAAHTINVGQGAPPTAVFVFSPTTPAPGEMIFFTAEASRAAPGRRLVSFDWNFGSGRTATGVSTSKGYDVAGNYVVTLTVTDDAGQQATTSQTVRVGGAGR